MNQNPLIDTSVQVVNMFDQANTAKVFEKLGSRGVLLKEAIEELRSVLNDDTQRTTLSNEQANNP